MSRLIEFDETYRAEVLMVPYKLNYFFDQIRPRADPGRGKNMSKRGKQYSFFAYIFLPNLEPWPGSDEQIMRG